MAPSSKISKAEWQRHEATIRDLYIVKNLTLNMLMHEMSSAHAFSASKYQYTTQLKEWKLQKNSTSDFWKGIGGSLKRRHLDVSEANVHFNGSYVPLKKLKKELPRYAAQATQPSNDTTVPVTPEGITIEPILEQLRSNKCSILRSLVISLPWHTLAEFAIPTYSSPILSLTDLHATSPIQTIPFDWDFLLPSQDDADLFHGVFPFVPWTAPEPPHSTNTDVHAVGPANNKTLGLTLSQNEVMKFFGFEKADAEGKATMERFFRPLVIERQPGETKRAVQDLMDPRSAKSMQILVSYMALLASNGLIEDEAIQAFLARTEEAQLLGIVKSLLVQRSPSAKAVATRILHAAIDINATKFLREALKGGADVESPSTGRPSLHLLQKALSSGKHEAARILMDAGAYINVGAESRYSEKTCEYRDGHAKGFTCECQIREYSPIALAARSDTCINLVPELLEKGAIIPKHSPVLIDAIKQNASVDIVSCLIDAGADVDQCFSSRSRQDATPLSTAARQNNLKVLQILLGKGANPNGPLRSEYSRLLRRGYPKYRGGGPPTIYNTPLTDALMDKDYHLWNEHYAARNKCCDNRYEIVRLLLKYGADPNISSLDIIRKELPLFSSDSNLEFPKRNFTDGILILYPLQAAATLGDVELVKLLLQHKTSLNTACGTPALTLAVMTSGLEMVGLLLSQGADPNGLGEHKYCPSALEAAAEIENLEVIDLLLEAGADVNLLSASDEGRTPLQRAAGNGNEQVIEHLLRHGASMLSPPARVRGASALSGFVKNRLHKYVLTALEAGANPNTNSKGGYSPLIAAVVQNDTASLSLLIAASANIHDYGSAELAEAAKKELKLEYSPFLKSKLSPIQWAALMDHVEVAKILCQAGANVNQPLHGKFEDTALSLAVSHGRYAMTEFLIAQMTEIDPYWDLGNLLLIAVEKSKEKLVELLLRNNADPNGPSSRRLYTDGDRFVTPLEAACRERDISMVETLLSNGADASRGCPLSSVFYMGFWGERDDRLPELLKILLEHGADVNARDDAEGTALQGAIEEEEFRCAYQLIENGACVNAPAADANSESGHTALQAAASTGDIDMVEHLLSRGADINAPATPYCGVTALQAAAISGYLGIAKILLEYGADIDAEAAIIDGRTAVDGAAEFGRIDMVKLLLDNYQGSKFSEVIESACLSAKSNCQWHVVELLKTYKKAGNTRG